MKTAIMGGGLSGLTLAYLLDQKGIEVEILEKEEECGGLMRSLQEKGFTFDYGGSHVIFSKNRRANDFMLNLLGNNKVRKRRNTKILYKDRYVKYPFENGLADLPREENFECLFYFLRNLIDKEKGKLKRPSNLKEWCYYTFGKGIADKYLIPYNEKIWKYPLEKTGLEWVERVPNPPIEDVVKSSLGIATEGYTHQLYFHYPKIGGIQALIRSLESKLENRIVRKFEVIKLKKEDGKWIVSDAKEERLFDKVISTIPVQKLLKAIGLPREIKDAADDLKYNSLISIMLGVNAKKTNELSWLYIPDKNVLPHRVSFPSNFSPNAAPIAKSSMLAEVTCDTRSRIWKTKDEKIVDGVTDDLQCLKIMNNEDVCFAKVKRTEYAYVINDLDYEQNIKIVKNYITKTGIDLVGRFAEFKYLNMDGCIKSAMDYTSYFMTRAEKPFSKAIVRN